MKLYFFIIFILILFLRTGNVLSEDKIFNVNNLELIKKPNMSYNELTNEAINKGFEELIERILLEEDKKKLSKLGFSKKKQLVSYYQIVSNKINENNLEEIKFNLFFDREKFHDLFFKEGISYSEITNKEIFLLPVLKNKGQVFIYNQNFFYEKWNEVSKIDLIDFILPIENIEVIQKINSNKDNLINLNLEEIFKEYAGQDFAFLIIELNDSPIQTVYLKARILGKEIIKIINIKKVNLINDQLNNEIISVAGKEIINIVKSQNLIDIRTPSFLNAKIKINKKNNLVELNNRLKEVNLIESIYIQELNNNYIYLKIKYLGKLSKIIKKLETQKVILKLIGDEWNLKII